MDLPSLGNFVIPIFSDLLLRKSAVVLSSDNKLKRLIPIILSCLKCSLSKIHVPKKESCIYSTVQK